MSDQTNSHMTGAEVIKTGLRWEKLGLTAMSHKWIGLANMTVLFMSLMLDSQYRALSDKMQSNLLEAESSFQPIQMRVSS